MPTLVPVDNDPFASAAGVAPTSGPTLTPVDHDPFATPSVADTAFDTAKGQVKALASTAQGLAGLPGDAEKGVNWLLSKIMPSPESLGLKRGDMPSQAFPTTADIDKYVPVSKLPDSETSFGKHAQNITEVAAPALLGGPEGIAQRVLTRGLLPGVVSDAAGTATQGTAAEPYARIAGALLAPSNTAEKFLPNVTKAVQPSTAALLDAGGEGFNTFRQMPFAVKPQAMDSWATNTINDLGRRNFDAQTAPNTIAALSRHVGPSITAVTAQDMDKTKMLLRDAQASGGNDATAASAALKSLNDRITSFTPNQTVVGNPTVAAKVWNDANGNYAAGMRSQSFDEAIKKANDQAFTANSGAGSGNKLRGTVANYINNDGKMLGVNAAEEAAMTKMAHGSFAQNLMRAASNKLGGGGGIGSTFAMSTLGELGALGGEETGNGMVLPAIAGAGGAFLAGKLSRGYYNRSVAKASDNISNMLRARSPLGAAVPPQLQAAMPSYISRLLAARGAMQGQPQ